MRSLGLCVVILSVPSAAVGSLFQSFDALLIEPLDPEFTALVFMDDAHAVPPADLLDLGKKGVNLRDLALEASLSQINPPLHILLLV
jgi:hypothetical protein